MPTGCMVVGKTSSPSSSISVPMFLRNFLIQWFTSLTFSLALRAFILSSLSSLGIFRDREVADLTIGEFVDATRGLQDREVLLLAGRSGAVCALRAPRLGGLSIRR